MKTFFFPQLEHLNKELYNINDFNKISPFPIDITKVYFKDELISQHTYNNNIFNLLLNDNYNHANYTYLFYEDRSILSRQLRYLTDGSLYYCLLCNSSGIDNIFELTSIDFEMLDLLLYFRMHNTLSSSLNIDINYYTTNLSKLIYFYLYSQINHSKPVEYTDCVCNESDNILTTIFENYVIKKIYAILKEV